MMVDHKKGTKMIDILLLWLLAGSISLNIMWMLNDSEKAKQPIRPYINGLVLGFIAGPCSLLIYYFTNKRKP